MKGKGMKKEKKQLMGKLLKKYKVNTKKKKREKLHPK